ncbi:hypothetical protein BBJ28_00021589 [Nothophytophthora sp. Chile5]|nr:hypothetical protein BBJ28_00021589 [Nothophytophthora sp. Chile5]
MTLAWVNRFGRWKWERPMRTVVDDEAAPPPPPPLSPPPTQTTTTIGKYIARFRYEKPQPREARAVVQRSEFWWTTSPRYARSPSPPSSWASGGAFDFPETERSEDDEQTLQEPAADSKDTREGGDEDVENVESVERKLRRRLGAPSSANSRSSSHRSQSVASPPIEAMASWESFDWQALELAEVDTTEQVLSEEDEEGDDPEEVIERVRRRLGWNVARSIPRPSAFYLSLENTQKPSLKPRHQQKPPLSPVGPLRMESFGSRGRSNSTCNWGSPVPVHGRGDQHAEPASLSEASSAVGLSAETLENEGDGEEYQWEGTLIDGVDEMELSPGDDVISSRGSGVPTVDRGTCSSETTPVVVNRLLVEADAAEQKGGDAKRPPIQLSDRHEAAAVCPEETLIADEKSSEHEGHVGETAASDDLQGDETIGHVQANLPALPAVSPVLWNVTSDPLTLPTSRRSQLSTSSLRSRDGRVLGETTATLDNLVSLVVHSWGDSPEKELEKREQEQKGSKLQLEYGATAGDDIGDAIERSAVVGATNGVNEEDSSARDSVESALEVMPQTREAPVVGNAPNALKIASMEVTQLRSDAKEEAEEDEVPGEQDDEIVRMLLERIALFELALRRIDS